LQHKHRFRLALSALGMLALLVWTTMEAVPIPVGGREIDFRLVPTVILGLFAVKVVLHRQATRLEEKSHGSESQEPM
jgi:hypothetical protein